MPLQAPLKHAVQTGSALRIAFLLLTTIAACRPANAAPVLNGGIVNAASYGLPGSFGVAAGSIATIFGTGLATSTKTADTLPLPFILGTTSVTVSGIGAALFYVSNTQINFQVPWQPCCADLTWQVRVTVNNVTSDSFPLTVSAFGPAIFSVDESGTGQGAVLIANTATFAAPIGGIAGAQSRPAGRGEEISIFCIGLGPVLVTPPNGFPGLRDPLSEAISPVTVTIGGVATTADFVGLAPGFVGLYQVNVQVPSGAPTGTAVPIRITDVFDGIPSPAVTIAIQ
jgi:uncharacterized protein (TIGR03437 family)